MNRTVEDYDSMAKREMIKAKQEKAMMSVYRFSMGANLCTNESLQSYNRRVQKFRSDYNEFKTQFERIKAEVRFFVCEGKPIS